MADLDLRPVGAEEFPALYDHISAVFGEAGHEADREVERAVFELDRSLAAFDGDTPVASAAAFSREMTLPGGPRPVAAVTWVAVAPTHRRRGLLTAMMRRQLEELHTSAGEPVAALWASETSIYGRFGYGLAARAAALSVRPREAPLAAPSPGGRTRLLDPAKATPVLQPLYDQVRRRVVGHLDRTEAWWAYRLHDPEHSRDGQTALRCAVHADAAGTDDAYAVYAVKSRWDARGPQGELTVRELVATTPAGYAAIWAFLYGIDLVREIRWRTTAADEPLQHLAADPRAVRLELADNVWVRLVDVDRALASRSYARELDVVLEVADPFCPWNAGRWQLAGGPGGGSCTRTDAGPDLTLGVADLGAAYLGGTRLATLAAAGRVVEHRPGALAATSAALLTEREPWCPEVF